MRIVALVTALAMVLVAWLEAGLGAVHASAHSPHVAVQQSTHAHDHGTDHGTAGHTGGHHQHGETLDVVADTSDDMVAAHPCGTAICHAYSLPGEIASVRFVRGYLGAPEHREHAVRGHHGDGLRRPPRALARG